MFVGMSCFQYLTLISGSPDNSYVPVSEKFTDLFLRNIVGSQLYVILYPIVKKVEEDYLGQR